MPIVRPYECLFSAVGNNPCTGSINYKNMLARIEDYVAALHVREKCAVLRLDLIFISCLTTG